MIYKNLFFFMVLEENGSVKDCTVSDDQVIVDKKGLNQYIGWGVLAQTASNGDGID